MITDICQSFMLENAHIRGRFVRLKKVTSEIIGKHAYPEAIARTLSDLLAAGSGLAGLLKYEGIFTLQSRTDGPISMSVVDVTHHGHVRGYAQFDEAALDGKTQFAELVGKGYLAFTVDQGNTLDRYQGIVSLEGETLCEGLQHYFLQSEQMNSRVVIRSHQSSDGEWQAVAMILQQMPKEDVEEDTWAHIDALLQTLNDKELFDCELASEEILYRLFHELNIQIYDPQELQAHCRCSIDRIKNFLASLSPAELEEYFEDEKLNMTCQFCNEKYTFGKDDIVKVH